MISYSYFSKLFSFECKREYCIEIEFLIKGDQKYRSCWMGKTCGKSGSADDVFWYGLMPDGSEAYDYNDFESFSQAPVFDGRTIEEIWDMIELLSVDGCDPEERVSEYIKDNL